MQIVCQQGQRLCIGRLADRPHELVSELVLNAWLLEERAVRLHVEAAVVVALVSGVDLEHTPLGQVFVVHVLLRQQQVHVSRPSFFLLGVRIIHK